MKTSLFLVSLVFFACSKREDKIARNLPSVWTETEHYYSIGGPVIVQPTASATAETIQFKEVNIFYSSVNKQFNRYRLDTAGAHNYIKLYQEGKNDTTTWTIIKLTANELDLGFNCIEGCGKRFTRL